MIKEYLEVGQIVSTHGIKGEVRLNPWCDSPEFLKNVETLYYDAEGKESLSVSSCRPHGNVDILKIEGVDTVERAAALRNKMLYAKRSDFNLPEGKWFISELIGCEVFDADNESKLYGVITDVAETGANDVWFIETPEKSEVLIPAVDDVIISCDVENNKVFIRPLRGLFDEV